jgi:hypothetical protein
MWYKDVCSCSWNYIAMVDYWVKQTGIWSARERWETQSLMWLHMCSTSKQVSKIQTRTELNCNRKIDLTCGSMIFCTVWSNCISRLVWLHIFLSTKSLFRILYLLVEDLCSWTTPIVWNCNDNNSCLCFKLIFLNCVDVKN